MSKTDDLEARLARVEARLETDGGDKSRSLGIGGMETVAWSMMRMLFPDETRRHMRAATREQLLAARAYIDHWLDRMDRGSTDAQPEPEREHINLE